MGSVSRPLPSSHGSLTPYAAFGVGDTIAGAAA